MELKAPAVHHLVFGKRWFRMTLVNGTKAIITGLWTTWKHIFRPSLTVQYPEVKRIPPPRYRARMVLTRDPQGEERCVACYLCSAACPVDCISMQAAEKPNGRRYAEWFRINFSRCIFCGFCEEACPTYAIQLTTDFEMGEYKRKNLVYEKEDLLISGPGKYPDYNFYRVAGLSIKNKDKGEAENEEKPVDVKDLMP